MAEFTWYGQASFGIVSESGLRVVTDPYDPEKAGFKPFPDPADIVIKSSSSDDFHDNDHLVPKKPGATVIDALEVALDGGTTSTHGIRFSAIEAMEHSDHPSGHPDQNAMYRFAVDGLEIGHMGDMGEDFSDDQLEFFSGVNVLLGHAGGFPVISLDELMRVIGHVAPRVVIPMHYRTPEYLRNDMFTIDEFLRFFPAELIDVANESTITIDATALPDTTRAFVLDPY